MPLRNSLKRHHTLLWASFFSLSAHALVIYILIANKDDSSNAIFATDFITTTNAAKYTTPSLVITIINEKSVNPVQKKPQAKEPQSKEPQAKQASDILLENSDKNKIQNQAEDILKTDNRKLESKDQNRNNSMNNKSEHVVNKTQVHSATTYNHAKAQVIEKYSKQTETNTNQADYLSLFHSSLAEQLKQRQQQKQQRKHWQSNSQQQQQREYHEFSEIAGQKMVRINGTCFSVPQDDPLDAFDNPIMQAINNCEKKKTIEFKSYAPHIIKQRQQSKGFSPH